MNKFKNKKRIDFLSILAVRPSLDDISNDLTIRCKFNFSYFDSSQGAGQKFSEWSNKELLDLLGKIKDYTTKPLEYWQNERVGSGGLKMLEIYGRFPPRSDFYEPKCIPYQAQWGRFRIAQKVRLVGFTIPAELHQTKHKKTDEYFDKNTFYVVFFDKNHRFCPSEKQ